MKMLRVLIEKILLKDILIVILMPGFNSCNVIKKWPGGFENFPFWWFPICWNDMNEYVYCFFSVMLILFSKLFVKIADSCNFLQILADS